MADLDSFWQPGRMTRDLRILFSRSELLNNFASRAEKYNFQSLLLAFTLCADITSTWFTDYVRRGGQLKNLQTSHKV